MSQFTIAAKDLRPGVVIRIGLQASGAVGHTFALRITEVDNHQPDEYLSLSGDRLTLAGRVVEQTTVNVRLRDLYPADITR